MELVLAGQLALCGWIRQVLRGWEEPVLVELRAMTPAQPGRLPACSKAHSDTLFPIPLTPNSLWLILIGYYTVAFPLHWLSRMHFTLSSSLLIG